AGIDRGSLRAVIQGARAQDRPVAIAVLTYLHREGGLPVGLALQRVRTAMGEGPDALRTLPGRAAAASGGGPPAWAGPSVGGEAAGKAGAPPAAVPAPGERPGRGRPEHSGRGISGGNSPGPGHSGGTPPGKGGSPPGKGGDSH